MDFLTWVRTQWDRAGAAAAVLIGAVMLVIGWVGVSGSGLAAEQIPYVITCGVGGLFVLGIGAVLWLSADLRDEWRKLDSVEDAIRAGTAATYELVAAQEATTADPAPGAGPAPAVSLNGSSATPPEPPARRRAPARAARAADPAR